MKKLIGQILRLPDPMNQKELNQKELNELKIKIIKQDLKKGYTK